VKPTLSRMATVSTFYVLALSAGHVSCTAIATTMVRKKPASWGWLGQNILVTSSFQAQNPAAVPIRLAINEILRVLMNTSSILYTRGTRDWFHGL